MKLYKLIFNEKIIEEYEKSADHIWRFHDRRLLQEDIDENSIFMAPENMRHIENIKKNFIVTGNDESVTITQLMINAADYFKIIDHFGIDPKIYSYLSMRNWGLTRLFNQLCRKEFVPLLHKIAERGQYIDLNLDMNSNLKKMGISIVDIIKLAPSYKLSKLTPNQLANLFDFETLSILLYYPHLNVDQQLWLIYHADFLNKTTLFKVKGVDIIVDNHNLISRCGAPIKEAISNYKNFKNSPKKLLDQSLVDSYLLSLYEDLKDSDAKYDIDASFKDTSYAKVLTSRLELIKEGKRMRHCVGGPDYHSSVKHGKSVIVSIKYPNHPDMTVQYVKAHDKFCINQAYYAENEKPSQESMDIAIKYLNEIVYTNQNSHDII